MKYVDYYEFLQISPNAEPETIHRVFRYLGARFHPDNPQSGDAAKFSILKDAYEVLSDPERRAEYDASYRKHAHQQAPISESVDLMDDAEGETNRRLAVMAVLYFRRRAHPESPDVPLMELETRMGFPRDYLDFTMWYLRRKGYIVVGDNASFSLTVEGVDYVESQRGHIPVLQKLLTSGKVAVENGASDHAASPQKTFPVERRLGNGNRRVSTVDLREKSGPFPLVERRSGVDRRSAKRNHRDRMPE